MAGNLGSLVFELQANMVKTQEDMGRLNQIVEATMRRIDTAAQRTSRNVEDVGRAGRTIQRMEGAEEAAKSIEKVGHTSVAARRELLVLAHELSQGNYKRFGGSLMVLGEQMDWMGKIMSPVGLAVGALTATLGGLAYAAVKGAEQQAAFGRAVQVTGNYAGMTESRFEAMTKSVAENSGMTVSAARDITQALLDTGRFGPASLEAVSNAAATMQHLTGQKVEEVVKDFAKMSDGALKWALEADKQYHFVTGALFDQVKALEDAGEKERAMVVVSDALTAAKQRQGEQINFLSGAWKLFRADIDDTINTLGKFLGKSESIDERIEEIRSSLESLPKTGILGGVRNGPDPREALQGALTEAVKKKMREDDNALLESQKRAHDAQVVEDKEGWRRRIEAHREGAAEMKRQIDAAIKQGEGAGAPQAEIDAEVARIKKSFEHGAKAPSTFSVDMVGDLRPLQDQINAEERLLNFREQTIAKYARDDKLSAQQTYDERVTVIQAYQARIKSLYEQEIQVVENAAARAKDARQRKEAENRAGALRDAEQAALLRSDEMLANADDERARATEKYREEVEKLTSALAKLSGAQGSTAGEDFDRANKGLTRQATQGNDAGTLDLLSRARAAAVAQGQINALKEQARVIEENLKTAEQQTALNVTLHQQTELQGMLQLGEQREKASQQLEGIAAQMQDIANASGLSGLIANADAFKLHVDEIKASSDVLGKSVTDTFASNFATALEKTTQNARNLKTIFLDMANSIEQAITRLVSQDLANQLFGIGQSQGSSGGGLFAKLIGAAIGMMSGSGDVEGAVSSDALSSPDWGSMEGRASGGPVVAGGMYRVNERGPELLTIANRTFLMMGDQPGSVTRTGSMESGGGARNTFHLNIAVPPGTTRASSQQQAREIMTQAQIAMARNG
ncbi:phage tail length tape measure family protein [Paraburkholderia phymatum]|uniref:Prophage tail length tape measure n=1 Tax=Paraburkholderia phymatum (strain DSM 17167 / CIP 108236 / LMG 21445 / STM815) TaxID=391038 RepID=B2JUI3_PARP8|nr:phage tail length tape measure family protein [Paraburkholderia phymatum]ACC76154.1 Prophage tail length tape measure [Paraburkholderia phymatum STM815]